MITVRIGSSERTLDQADTAWLVQQIKRREENDEAICIQVLIQNDDLNMVLSTANCSRNGTSNRPPTDQEQEIFDLWKKHRLNESDINKGKIISFLNQLRQVLSY